VGGGWVVETSGLWGCMDGSVGGMSGDSACVFWGEGVGVSGFNFGIVCVGKSGSGWV
jgi:hypothetical protein